MGASVGLDAPATSAAGGTQPPTISVLTASTNPTISVLLFIDDLLVVYSVIV
jgi:hypothetical protein